MIREWLSEDGRTVRYDDILNVIDYRDVLNVIVEGPREATDQEVMDFRVKFPEVSAEEVRARNAVIQGIDELILLLRTSNADGNITTTEFNNGAAKMLSAMTAFSRRGKTDDELTFKVLVALINAVQSVTLITQDLNLGLYASLAQQQDIRTQTEEILDRLDP